MRQRTFSYRLVVVAACSLVALGCNRDTPPDRIQQGASVQQDDDRIATYVRARYQTDSSIRANDIHVSASEGVVTLRGTVPDEKVRQHAVSVAEQMEGVRSDAQRRGRERRGTPSGSRTRPQHRRSTVSD